MIEFNIDGSIKLPEHIIRYSKNNEEKLKKQKCIKITRDVVSDKTPKKCILHITVSEAFPDNKFIQTIYDYFKNSSSVPSKLIKINEKEFDVEIGTDFKRCSDCNSLINRYREFLEGNIIEEKGSCQFEDRMKNFCYEDYF